MIVKSLFKYILVLLLLGITPTISLAQDMLLLCSSSDFVKSHLSAYPDRLTVKSIKVDSIQDKGGEWLSMETLLVYDDLLKCNWEYRFTDNSCFYILVTVSKNSDLENWTDVLDSQFYRQNVKGKIIWVKNGETIGRATTAAIDYEKNTILFLRFLCD